MSKLLIVESPAKAKTIEKYLDGAYKVVASVGHVRDLPKSNKKAIDITAGFVPHYEVSKGKDKILRDIKSLAKKADEVVLATDPDREGEAIAWHLSEALGLKNPKRIVFNEITKEAVQEAIKNPRSIDNNLRRAQEARRVLDRLVGYDLSGLIWKKVRYGLSAGRVQSPALRIIMEKEREIRAFKSEQYWAITADVETNEKELLTLICAEEPRDKELMEKIIATGEKVDWNVLEIKESDQKRSPKAPFTTSTLQQTASSRLGFSPYRTMGIAQKLYEKGYITYMRTDSPTLSNAAVAQIFAVIESEFGKESIEARTFKTKSKSAQEAHEAIRPTDVSKKSAGATPEQKKLYELIRVRTIASQMIDAQLKKTKIIVSIDNNLPTFGANGSRVISPGWLSVDTDARGEDVELPKLKKEDSLKLKEMHTEEKETLPPPRYSEAGLVKELEKRGIGRPSTYAAIIKTLKDRGYVEKEGRSMIPTDTGDVVSSFLEKNFANYISDSFTSEMEDELDEIAEGKRAYEKTLKDFYGPFTKEVESKAGIEKLTNLGDAPKEFPCPKCGKPMVIKLSKNGKFMSCSDFPECHGARTIEGEELEGLKETGEDCPDCKDGKLVERDGRYGRFISCNRYPKCKFIKEDPEALKKASTGVTCPECEEGGRKGEMVEKRGRYGVFYACSVYPDCKYTTKAKPTGEKCPMCGKLMMEGTKTIPERCSNKGCPNHRPDKLDKGK
jgi:DNA topoisomerase-1